MCQTGAKFPKRSVPKESHLLLQNVHCLWTVRDSSTVCSGLNGVMGMSVSTAGVNGMCFQWLVKAEID